MSDSLDSSEIIRLDLTEIEIRNMLVDQIEAAGGSVGTIRNRIMDYSDYTDFEYSVYRVALKNAGVTTEHLTMDALAATTSEKRSMKALFDSTFLVEKRDISAVFEGCRDIREKMTRLTELSEADLIAVWDDQSIEFVIRSYAQKIMTSDVKDLNSIVDQAIGKPIERHLNVNRTEERLGLSASELKRLLASCEDDDEAIEVEAEEVEDEQV